MKRALRLTAALSGLTLLLASCGGGSSSAAESTGPAATPTSGGTLTILTSSTEQNYDPAKSQSLAITSLALVHRRLTTWDIQPGAAPTVVPDLATDTGTPSDDGKTWTFTLKDGLKFADGTPITSADIKYGLERSFAPALSGGLTYHKALLVGGDNYPGPFEGAHLDSIQTPDDKTIVFQLKQPFADFPWIAATPAFAPVPAASEDIENYSVKAVASGPYQIKEAQPGISLTLTRNPAWDPATDPVRTALPDEIVFQLGQDPTTAAQRILQGSDPHLFGAARVPASQLARLASDPGAQALVHTSDPGPLQYLAINTQTVPDVRVRQALNYAIDKNAVVLAAGGELGGSPATTYITPGIPGRVEYNLYATNPAGDPEKAKALLAEAGVSNLTLRFLVRSDSDSVAIAEAVAQSLARVGITVQIDPVETGTFTERTTQGDGSSYDLTLQSWNADYPSPYANLYPLYESSQIGAGGYNVSRYANPAVDQAIADAVGTIDPAAAGEKWAAIDQQIAADAPSVPLFYARNSFVAGPGVAGVVVQPFPAYQNYLVVGLSGQTP
ncbi:ABC transporter substrate-binding protein [Buchananella hordeovulneris]|uniref:ABC transporter substrate-binding protein n=1 Tax=Buchananella hordeovulneris TaxID=52770 RepID=UPI000F5F60A7|nr:ABC transporter substrate-binding protein [Buchananella hordeovulneris]RRD44372.1 ABC transporter substrate-binding protein [Buchananella hordeovulneris]